MEKSYLHVQCAHTVNIFHTVGKYRPHIGVNDANTKNLSLTLKKKCVVRE
jgi:hypothetical protein